MEAPGLQSILKIKSAGFFLAMQFLNLTFQHPIVIHVVLQQDQMGMFGFWKVLQIKLARLDRLIIRLLSLKFQHLIVLHIVLLQDLMEISGLQSLVLIR